MSRRVKLKTKLIGMIIGVLVLSCAAILAIGLVSLRKAVYHEKELQTREFVNIGLSVLKHYHSMELEGLLTTTEAQDKAKEAVKSMTFGERNLDYYWINDFHPRMIMYPFRPDLDGQDLSTLKDPDGLNLFVEMVKVCREAGKGYVPYKWQYYDDEGRIEPKLSYVAEFKPWRWIIGTGVYINDVTQTVYRVAGTLLLISLIALLLAASIAFLFSRNLSNLLTRIAESLGEGAEQVASASGQVASASQSLAEGASEQAAGVEEVSASMEEMSSMTRQNADHASQADALMKQAKQIVDQADQSMTRLSDSMHEISRASEETSKIIKTIDEIAFQTNLLALNAAVEAARAGEAGAGFAVVADEVRNLAMRAADAAKNTSNLIEGTVKKIKEGAELTAKTNQAFTQVADSSHRVAQLVGEISAASKEQAQGIDQVNKGISEMDKVIQQNAANAEESAAASEELNAQAEQMKSTVVELVTLVNGGGTESAAASPRSLGSRRQDRGARGVSRRKPERATGPASRQTREVRPDQLIPLDDKNLKDF